MVESLEGVAARTRVPLTERVFSGAGGILGRFRAVAPHRMQANQRLRRMMSRSETNIFRISEPASVPAAQPELPGLPPVEQPCRRCGAAFLAPARREVGRPVAFCCDECRHEHAAELRRAWHAEHDAEGAQAVLACWTCGEPFDAPPRTQGRSPRFCSQTCRQAHRAARAAATKVRRRRAGLPNSTDHERD